MAAGWKGHVQPATVWRRSGVPAWKGEDLRHVLLAPVFDMRSALDSVLLLLPLLQCMWMHSFRAHVGRRKTKNFVQGQCDCTGADGWAQLLMHLGCTCMGSVRSQTAAVAAVVAS